MKVTDIQLQVKDKGRYSVFIDDAFAFGISELGLIESGIRIGLELSPADLAALKENAQADKLYNMTLSLIMRRPRSQWEVQDYLKRKEADPLVAAQICKQLLNRGYINDADFAKRWVENRRILKPISRRKLELELKQKRVSDTVIRQVLALDADETDESQVIRKEVAKKRRQTRYQDDTKLMQYLARQGYNYDDIKSALADSTG